MSGRRLSEPSFPSSCYDDDVLFADTPNDVRADLLIATPEDVSLPANCGYNDLGRKRAFQKFDKLRLRYVRRDDLPVQNHVNAKQRFRDTQNVRDALRGGAGAEYIQGAVLHGIDDLPGNGQNILSLVGMARRLGDLHV